MEFLKRMANYTKQSSYVWSINILPLEPIPHIEARMGKYK
jgi:hypothetical protein